MEKLTLSSKLQCMSFWNRLFGKTEPAIVESRPLRDIPHSAMAAVQTLRCDPSADPHHRFSVGRWGLEVADDPDSQRYAQAVLKRSAGKNLRLEPHAEAGHRGVISSLKSAGENSGYKWIYVDVDLRAGTIRFHEGSS